MRYATQFPGFPASAIPAFMQGEGWTDASWRQDDCPFFVHDASGLGVWCDWGGDPDSRAGAHAFTVVQLAHHAEHGWQHDNTPVLFETDDETALHDMVEEVGTGTAPDVAARYARLRTNALTVEDARTLLAEETAHPNACPEIVAHLQEAVS